MILSFKEKFPWGENTWFIDKIMASVKPQPNGKIVPKYHTIRTHNRFKKGTIIHMATGVRSKNYYQFNKGTYELQRVKCVQRFDLSFRSPNCVALYIDKKLMYCRNEQLTTEGHFLTLYGKEWMEQFVKNDGFESIDQFFKWFKKPVRRGSLIHWTDLKY
jgi:hypothetical protein